MNMMARRSLTKLNASIISYEDVPSFDVSMNLLVSVKVFQTLKRFSTDISNNFFLEGTGWLVS